ncbi:hypothetical protein WR25_21993 [Diploscapter pachys]|uniref:Uncharacterized protein n=1 Tax=Diploscapter pachys TaxID=2018661 RepID=A0A2A2L973_9BILA|nr:hypothetical protein WR25_21993 [Diploscapter pachys]
MGDMYNAPRLRQRAVQFILARPKNVTMTPGWTDILKSHPYLVTDIINNIDKPTTSICPAEAPPSGI